jgi:repressor LexA
LTKQIFCDNIILVNNKGEIDMRKKDPDALNKREKAILKYIEKQVVLNGYPPSVREIGKAVGLKSTATVHGYIESLEKKGYVKKESQKGRTLKLLKGGNLTDGEQVSFDKPVYTNKEMVDVPVVGKITAGAPILAVENVTDTFPIPIDFVGNCESFMLTVRGESMIEAGILNGDYILVRKQNTATNGEIVVALIEDEATVKTFYKEKDHIRLQPENSTMDPIIVPNCEILGKVIGVFRKM